MEKSNNSQKTKEKGPNHERKASLANKGGPQNPDKNEGTQAKLPPEEHKLARNPSPTPKFEPDSLAARRHNHEITEEEEHDIEKFFKIKDPRNTPHNTAEVKPSENENPEPVKQNVSVKKVSNPKTKSVNQPPGNSETKHSFSKFDDQELHDIEKFFVHSPQQSRSRELNAETDSEEEHVAGNKPQQTITSSKPGHKDKPAVQDNKGSFKPESQRLSASETKQMKTKSVFQDSEEEHVTGNKPPQATTSAKPAHKDKPMIQDNGGKFKPESEPLPSSDERQMKTKSVLQDLEEEHLAGNKTQQTITSAKPTHKDKPAVQDNKGSFKPESQRLSASEAKQMKRKSVLQGGHTELEEKPGKKQKNNAAHPDLKTVNLSVPTNDRFSLKVETVPKKFVKKADPLSKPELGPGPKIRQLRTKSDKAVLKNGQGEQGQGSKEQKPAVESDLSRSSSHTFTSFHSSGESESLGKPDMTWIIGSDGESDQSSVDLMEEPVKENIGNERLSLNQEFSGISRLLSLVTMLGRLPFVIYKETDAFRCKRKPSKRQWDLYLLTCILSVAFIMSSSSVFNIVSAKVEMNANDSSSQYANFEKLLFQKHWLHITVFLLTFIVALVGNVSVILYGNHISKYINDVGESLEDFKYKNASKGTRTMKFVHLFITALDVVVLVAFFFTSDLGFQESVKFETILYLRWGLKEAFLDNFWMNIAVYVVPFFEIYVYFVARNHLLLIMVLCLAITNTAHGWNTRTAHLLESIAPKNEESVKQFGMPLSYKTLQKQHLKITKLIEGISNCSTPVLFSYFATRVLCISCEMFRASTAFLFDLTLKHVNGSETISGNSGVHVKYDPTELESIVEIFYFLSTTLISLFVVISTISAVGVTVMHGFKPVRRYGLLLADSLKGRKFIMSLYMSFNTKRPHIVNPGSWFLVNKNLFLSIVGTALLLFSIMIQWNVVNLVETQIVLACPHDRTKLCVKSSKTKDVKKYIDENAGATFEIPPSIRTTRPTSKATGLTSVTISTDNPGIITTKTPTTIKTTPTTTTKPPKPCSKGTEIVEPTASLQEKTKLCGINCPLSRAFRMVPFSEGGKALISTMKFGWTKTNEIVECLANPYGNFEKGDPVHDCFGNCYSERDDLGRFAFSLSGKGNLSKLQLNAGEFSYKFECFSENVDSPYFNPLEVCGIPYAYTHMLYDYYNSNHNPPFAKATLIKMMKAFPNNHVFDVSQPKCDKKDVSLTNSTEHPHLAIKVEVSQSQAVWRLVPYSFVYGGVGLQIPFWWGGQIWNKASQSFQEETPPQRGDRHFAFPYFYMDALFTSKKFPNGTIDKSAISSFGMHDCFGNQLDEFDDCGALPFWIFDRDGILKKPRKTYFGRYRCWESPIPDYSCGAPEDKPELIFKLCATWSEYLSKPR
ncbi:hypothetical protein Fcan01_08602 [Folsomia candida]|uniref:Uncharacterized protein n=1 Tax=Folsomia candida TaxID=158441 RepID=A0A226EC44_FOLCA|nr:hypothetical protein Fcan01_08602 [Folsomia candida]